MRAAADFKERIVARRADVGRIEQEAVREALPPPSRQLPVLALDVMDDSRAGPAEQRRHDQAHALTRAGGGECHDVLGPVVTKVSRTKPPAEDRKSTRLNSSH